MSLLKGEKLDFEIRNTIRAVFNDSDIDEKYAIGEVRIVTEQARYPLTAIAEMVNSDSYILNPDFQRRRRWNITKQSRLIESFIINVPIPPIFLYEYKYGSYEVMDGLQRLTAISDFYLDKIRLQDLEQWPELNEKCYSELPPLLKAGIDRRHLSSVILLTETAKDEVQAQKLKQLVFERLNSGGTKLEPQESRNAIYDGPMNRMCVKLSYNEFLCETWKIPLPTANEYSGEEGPSTERLTNRTYQKMTDVELVLRFFAYRQKHTLHKEGTLSNYFDRYLENANLYSEKVLLELENLFNSTIQFAYELFGEKAFFLYRERTGIWNWHNRPTIVVFDPLMFILSNYLEHKEIFISNSEKINQEIEEFYKLQYEIFEGRDVNTRSLQSRELLYNEFFKKYVN